jgi:adenylate cyclase
MSAEPTRSSGILAELRRRKVFRVAAVYGAVGFVLVQVANNFFPALHLPAWTTTLVAVLVVLGLPVALVLAWALELTPEGVRRAGPAGGGVAGPGAGADAGRARPGPDGPAQQPAQAQEGSPAQQPAHQPPQARGGWSAQRIAAVGGTVVLALAGGAFLLTGGPRAAGGFLERELERELERSIAVLPFANLSAERENEYFSDGITEDIRGRLSRMGELRVISRTSAMGYKGTPRTARDIGRELGVAHLVEGTVQRSGDRLRVSAQLVDARTDETQWSDTFDRHVTDVFAIQSEIAERIAEALRVRLTAGDRARLGRGQTTNLAAYELYLQASSLLARRAPGPAERRAQVVGALALLRQAVELDPEYALPHAFLAWAYDEHPDLPLRERKDSSRVFAERVIRMAPDLPDGYAEMGWHLISLSALEQAGAEFRLALDRDPNHEVALAGMAHYERLSGRPSRALPYARRRVDVGPTDPNGYHEMSQVHAAMGDFEAAEAWTRRAWLEVSQNPGSLHCELADLAWNRGDLAAARRHLDALLALDRLGEYGLHCAAMMELALGNVDAARELAGRGALAPFVPDGVPRPLLAALALHEGDSARAGTLLREAEAGLLEHRELCEGRCMNYSLAQVRALQGRTDEAVELVRRAVETGWSGWYPSAPDPLMASVETDRRYQAVLSELRERLDRERERAGSQRP